jgi:hypothetical protein
MLCNLVGGYQCFRAYCLRILLLKMEVQSSLVINPSGVRHFDLHPMTFMTTFHYKLLKFDMSRLLININVPNLKRKLKFGNKSKINYSIQIVFNLHLFNLSPNFQERIPNL